MLEHSETALDEPWLGLVIGNTRLHWAWFDRQQLQGVWHTPHLTQAQATTLIQQNFAAAAWRSLRDTHSLAIDLPDTLTAPEGLLPLDCASVVPKQTALWQTYPSCRTVQLADLPLAGLYPSLGIDRALNLWGAGDRYGWPILVIDAGTALTFTAGAAGRLVGGAILPGLSTQFAALTQTTATLPATQFHDLLPPRWATDPSEAIRSGILYGILATLKDFVQAWRREYASGQVVLTGGDGARLYHWWSQQPPVQSVESMVLEPNLAFWGLARLRHHRHAKDR